TDDTDDTDDYSDWSFTQLVIDKEFQDFPSVLVHSSVDPRVPAGNLDGLVAKIANKNESGVSNICVVDTGTATHVQSNADLPLAKDLVDFLLGASSSRCATDDGGSDTGG
ncbi:MAG: hypothetical protein GY884_05075, partial [Proteobacteria bacterium]|nr:hypothetical protein [Pseudomonadota bacterium]